MNRYEVTIKFDVLAPTPEEAAGLLAEHIHASLTGGFACEFVEVVDLGQEEDE